MKTSKLTGGALDWAVAKCEGLLAFGWEDDMGLLKITFSTGETEYFIPTVKWEQGGPIIEREVPMLMRTNGGDWIAQGSYDIANDTEAKRYYGKTLLEAAMRCYVAAKLGETVDVPVELLSDGQAV
jgi:hypothetical protein